MNGYILEREEVTNMHSPLAEIGQVLLSYGALVLRAVVVLLGFRFALKFMGASGGAPLTDMLYRLTDSLLHPFGGSAGVPMPGGVVEWRTLGVMAAYIAVGMLALAVIRIVGRLRTRMLSTPPSTVLAHTATN